MLVKQIFSKADVGFRLISIRKLSNRNVLSLRNRGMYQEMFPETHQKKMIDLLNGSPQSVYAGFDPTADSLHVGNLLVLINLLHWQRGGHNAIALIGGATAQIGDPSGRTTERTALTKSVIADNIKGLQENIDRIFQNHLECLWKDKVELTPVKVLNNIKWYENLSAIEFLSGAGREMRVGPLISRKHVKDRLDSSGMSFTEFSYPLFQSYDWLHLYKAHGCRFQIGGSDQMGNILAGHDLISRLHGEQVFGLTLPLVTTETGDKFGKSAGNAIWLSKNKTSYFTFYQFWIRTPDSEVEKLLKLFTFETVGAISDLMRQHSQKPELKLPQKKLAEQVMLLVHGEEGLRQARTASEALYDGNVELLGSMNVEEVTQMFQGATVVDMVPEPGQSVLDMAMKAKCFPTNNDAVRIISAGGFYINQQKAKNPNEILNPSVHRLQNNVSLVRVGKRTYYILKWQ